MIEPHWTTVDLLYLHTLSTFLVASLMVFYNIQMQNSRERSMVSGRNFGRLFSSRQNLSLAPCTSGDARQQWVKFATKVSFLSTIFCIEICSSCDLTATVEWYQKKRRLTFLEVHFQQVFHSTKTHTHKFEKSGNCNQSTHVITP